MSISESALEAAAKHQEKVNKTLQLKIPFKLFIDYALSDLAGRGYHVKQDLIKFMNICNTDKDYDATNPDYVLIDLES